MQFSVSKRIFIVGCARSGTTLLQGLLATHPQITSFPESKFFSYLVPQFEHRRLAIGISSRHIKPILKEFFNEIGHPELAKSLPKTPLFLGQYTRKFTKMLDEIAEYRGKNIWVEKTPEHLEHIEYIERFIPEAKIIHIIRDGKDVVSSIYDLAKQYPHIWNLNNEIDLDSCIDLWIKAISISQSYLYKQNHFFVQYKELIADTSRVLKEICQFIDIEFCQEMVEHYSDVIGTLVREREVWKANNSREIKNTNSQKFYQLFNTEQQEYITWRLASINVDFNNNSNSQKAKATN